MIARRLVLSGILLLLLMSIVSSVPIEAQDHDFSPIVTVNTDKPTYKPGETVVITGRYYCSICGKGFAAEISIRIGTPDGVEGPYTTRSNDAGDYSMTVSLSKKATPGPYAVGVTASSPGYPDVGDAKPFTVEGGTLTVSVKTDKAVYSELPAVVTVWGFVDYDGEGVSAATVTIKASGPGGVENGPWTVETDAFGGYNKQLSLSKDAALGTYFIYVTASKEGFSDGVNDYSFEVKDELTVEVATNKKNYNIGETVIVFGFVKSGNQDVSDANVKIVIKAQGGELAGTWEVVTKDGYFEKSLAITEKALPGTYTVHVSVHEEGYGDASDETSFTVSLKPLQVTAVATLHLFSSTSPWVDVDIHVVGGEPTHPIEGAEVGVVCTCIEDNTSLGKASLITDKDGHASVDNPLVQYGTYKVEVTASKDGFTTGKWETTFILEPRLKVSVTVDQQYSDCVEYYEGTVKDIMNAPVEEATIDFWVKSPSGKLTGPHRTTSSTGGVWKKYIDMEDDAERGKYIVQYQASKEGYKPSTQYQTWFHTEGNLPTLEEIMRAFTGPGIALRCPVNVLITDSNGRCDGCFSNGTLVHDIPESYFNMNETSDGRYWLFGLPPDTYNITITGTADGSFNLRLSSQKGIIQEYGMQPITKDGKATMILTPDNPTPLLTLSNGETVQPKNKNGDQSLGTMGIIAAVILLIIVAAVWKRKKIPLSVSQSKVPRGDHCLRCGSTFQIEDRYCPNCGASLDDQ